MTDAPKLRALNSITAVLDAEHDAILGASTMSPDTGINKQYRNFALRLCRETATEVADQHTMYGLPLAVSTARSVQLYDELGEDINERLENLRLRKRDDSCSSPPKWTPSPKKENRTGDLSRRRSCIQGWRFMC